MLKRFDCVRLTEIPVNIVHAFYKYYCFIRPEYLKAGWSRERIVHEISGEGIPCFTGSCWNISAEKCFVNRGWNKSKTDLPNAYALKDTSLMFLVHPTLEKEDIYRACEVISKVLKEAGR